MTLTKQWEINTAHDDKKVLKKEKNILILESMIFVRPVARQKSGNYKLRMIVKVAYSLRLRRVIVKCHVFALTIHKKRT